VKVSKYCCEGLLGYRDDEVRVSCVWGRGKGRATGMAREVCLDKGMFESWTVR